MGFQVARILNHTHDPGLVSNHPVCCLRRGIVDVGIIGPALLDVLEVVAALWGLLLHKTGAGPNDTDVVLWRGYRRRLQFWEEELREEKRGDDIDSHMDLDSLLGLGADLHNPDPGVVPYGRDRRDQQKWCDGPIRGSCGTT